jgi:outer membrane protein OmpA-like peptidoglycan-associated protein
MLALVLAASFATSSCQTRDAYTDETKTSKATQGAVVGALGGAAVGALTNRHDAGKNALIGAGIGAAVGGGIGYYMDRQEEELRKELRSAGVSVERRGDTIALNMQNDILFGVGSAALEPRANEVIHAVAIVLNKYRDTSVDVNGFTDTSGTRKKNEELSHQRAEAVADEMMRNGVEQQRLNVHGLGETNLRVPTADGVVEARNRRGEILPHPQQLKAAGIGLLTVLV